MLLSSSESSSESGSDRRPETLLKSDSLDGRREGGARLWRCCDLEFSETDDASWELAEDKACSRASVWLEVRRTTARREEPLDALPRLARVWLESWRLGSARLEEAEECLATPRRRGQSSRLGPDRASCDEPLAPAPRLEAL
jgi:hypothetical protein